MPPQLHALNQHVHAAKGLQGLAKQLCGLSKRQMQQVAPLLEEEHLSAIAIAQGVPRTNQAHGRQLALIGRMLNSLEEATQAQLAGVLQRAEQNTGFRLDPQAEAQAQEWHISILSGDEEVLQTVVQMAVAQGQEYQQLRQLAKQCRQGEEAAVKPSKRLRQLLQLIALSENRSQLILEQSDHL
eukprot:jgi/Astpho2/3917/Aster-x0603